MHHADLTLSSALPNPIVEKLSSGYNLIFNLTGKADGSVDDIDFPDIVMDLIKGLYLSDLEIIPGTNDAEPSAAFTFSIENARGLKIINQDSSDESANTEDVPVTGTTVVVGHSQMGVVPRIDSTLTMKCGDIGLDNTVQVIVKIEE